MAKASVTNNKEPPKNAGKKILTNSDIISAGSEEKAIVHLTPRLSHDALPSDENKNGKQFTLDHNEEYSFEREHAGDELDSTSNSSVNGNKSRLKRSNSTSALKAQPVEKKPFTGDGRGSLISEFYAPDYEGLVIMPLRRYRNFERLHRHLKDIPNYTLHLPPKRIFSSSTEDAFVHQRCIQLDKYLQDLLSIANIAEQHEVWDFLSVSSKNYSFGKSSSVMRTLAVNVDDAVDDIVRQFKGVSDGLMRKVVGSPSLLDEPNSSICSSTLSWHADESNKTVSRQDTSETVNSFSDNEESSIQESQKQEGGSGEPANGWHSDNELNSKGFPPRVIKRDEDPLGAQKKHCPESKSDRVNRGGFSAAATSSQIEDPVGMPPEWTPPNVSVPLLNLVDKVFQLKRRGWLRRQVFWISKQILQLIMEDAIDDWLLRQIYWLRREDIVAQGIRWLQDALWPGGTFFTRVGVMQGNADDAQINPTPFQVSQFSGSKASKQSSFEEQLEAARRASDIKKMLFDGAPAALVSLIGAKQYKRCARDIFYFTQSTICVKQVAYAILELLFVSVFPELRDLVLDIHGKTRVPPA
ncbi:hypothetical protein GH714_041931 [Hevea brasiliensis]|uniref:PX domain-containing protein n=1 Tax=Hevea brasiliensis TaxID=3981 RepID=A0A6A6MSR3_HEVBR|nr:hypothetical protein GH714_041931 [Hevea brasiliensis]